MTNKSLRIRNTILFCLFFGALGAQTTVYIGPVNGDWFTAANWNAGLPAPGNNALVPGGNTVVIGSALTANFNIEVYGGITINAALTSQNTFTNAGTLTVNGTGSLTNKGSFQNYGPATFVAPASFTNDVGATWNNFSTFTLPTTLLNKGTAINNGTINAAGATVTTQSAFDNNQILTARTLNVVAATMFTNQFGSTLNISGAGAAFNADGFVTNNGTINNAGAMVLKSVFTNNVNIINTGTLSVNPGAQLNNGGTVHNQGTFTNLANVTNNNQFWNDAVADNFAVFANNNMLENRVSGTFTNKPGATLDCGFGSQLKNFGTFVNKNNLGSVGAVTNNGTFTNDGTMANNTGGSLANNTTFNNNGTINSANSVTNNGAWTNTAALNINSGSIFTNNGTFTNTPAGRVNNLFEFWVKTGSTFTNNGILTNNIRLYVEGTLYNNAYLLNPGDAYVKPGGTLHNREILDIVAGNVVNEGLLRNEDRVFLDDCSSLNNTGTVDNTGGQFLSRGIIFQRGTVTGNAIVNTGGYIHTGATSNAPAVCQGGDFSANDMGEVKVYATSLIAFENFDSCGNIVYRANGIARPLFHCSDIGMVQNVNVVMTTRLGDSLTCVAPVSPVDALAPHFANCPPHQVVYTAGNDAPATWTAPTATDNCSATVTVTSTHTPGATFAVGITGVTYTATDNYGNAQNCQFKVSVFKSPTPSGSCTGDATPPVFVGCPANVNVTSNYSADQAIWTPPTLIEACLPVSLSSFYSPGDYFPEGATTVTYVAKDGNGNSSTCSFTVNLTQNNLCTPDNRKPVIDNCPANMFGVLNTDINGAVVLWQPPAIGDNCAIQSITSSHQPGSIFPSGATTVTYTAADASGNTAVCTFVVTVGASDPCPGDVAGPTISNCPQNITVTTNNASATATWAAPTASDACTPVTMSTNFTPGSTFPLGATEVTYQASDKKGNKSLCVFDVLVNTPCSIDITAPTISNCPADITVVSTNGSTAVASWTAPTATDNCTLASLISVYLPGSAFPIGETIIVYTATDLKFNTAACQFKVTVLNNAVTCTQNANPVNNTTDVPVASVTLNWNTAPNATKYDVYLGTTNPPTVKVGSDVTTTSYTASNLNGMTDYYWYIVPKNTASSATGCAAGAWKFTTGAAPSGCSRTTNGIVALYDFKEGSGSVIKDVSGVGTPLDLTIFDPNKVSRIPGGCGISVNESTIIKSSAAGTKLKNAISVSNAITIEAWVKPANITQNGPARIATYSTNSTERNFMIGQDGDDYVARFRTSTTDNNGTPTVAATEDLSTTLQHVVYTRDASGNEKIYVDNVVKFSGTRTGLANNWNSGYYFALANEMTLDRAWLGEMYLVAVYSKALSAAEVGQNFGAGPCCGDTDPGACKGEAGSGLYREVWNGITGNELTNLTGNANYPDLPSSAAVYTAGSIGPVNVADNYGSRVRGFLTPAQTGTYYFTLTGDDYTELYLSNNASPVGKVKIAYINGWTNTNEFNKYASQKSAAITLTAGQDYYLELLHKEGTGGDHWGIRWQVPNSGTPVPVPVQFLSPLDPGCDGNPPPACANNLITDNPGFENGLDGYWKVGTAASATDAANSELKSAKMCDGEGGFGKDIAAIPGKTYTLTAFAKKTGSPLCGVLKIEFKNSSNQVIDYAEIAISATDWQQYTVSKVAPAGTAYVNPMVWKCQGGCLYVDDFCVTATGGGNPPFVPDPNKCYKFVNKASGKTLDIKDNSTSNGAQVIQWDSNNGANQKFKFVDVGGGYYKIVAQHSGKVIDINGSSTSNDAYAQQWAYGSSDNQKFKIETTGANGYYKIVAKHSGKALRLKTSPGSNGTRIVQYSYSEGADQNKWQIVEVDCPTPVCNPTALFVVGNTNLSSGDAAVKNRLQGLGITVTVKDDAALSSADANGKGLVVVSSSCYSGDVNTKLTNVAVPVLCYESWLLDDLKMTGLVENTNFGLHTEYRVKMKETSHPIADGMNGTKSVLTSAKDMSWGKPSSSAVVVAEIHSQPSRKAIFAYETGATMVGMSAPARRTFIFLRDNNPTSLTTNGWTLFDNAVKWTSNCPDLDNPNAVGSSAELTFDAHRKDRIVELKWRSTTGPDNDYFTVERSRDGLNFETIMTLEGEGEPGEMQYFREFDEQPLGGTSYYRLRLVQHNGDVVLTDAKRVYLADLDAVSLFPNPAADRVNLALAPFAGRGVHVTVVNQLGQPVRQLEVQATEDPLPLDLSGLPQGAYWVAVQCEGERKTLRLIVTQ